MLTTNYTHFKQKRTNRDWAEIEKAAKGVAFLDVSCNAFTQIAFSQVMQGLEVLDISYNETTIAEAIFEGQHFPDLKHLYLFQSKLQKITFKGSFPSLETLHLAENELSQFVLADFPKLKTLYLYKNPLQNIPKEIFDKERGNVWEGVKSLLGSKTNPSNLDYLRQAKMILIGNGEVGKSSVLYRLKQKKGSLPVRDETQGRNRGGTQGIAVETHTLKSLPTSLTGLPTPINFDLSVWDFGGQGAYREVQQLFCSRKALYLFVTAVNDTTQNQEYIGWKYWLAMAKAFGHDADSDMHSPVIFVLNKCDLNGKKDINEEKYKALGNVHEFVKISCEPLENFEQLENAIRKTLPKIGRDKADVFQLQFNKKWLAVKKQLEERKKKGENYLSLQEYEADCSQQGMSKVDAKTWLEYLDRVGELIHFSESTTLRNFIILKPEWVRDAMYQVLDNEVIIRNKGVFYPEQFKEVWSKYNPKKSWTGKMLEAMGLKTYTPFEHEKLLELMLAYKFCYEQLDDEGKKFYLIPALFPKESPPIKKGITTHHYLLRFVYSPLIPAGTVNKLIVELHADIYQNYRWKNTCILHLLQNGITSFAKVEEKWEENAIYVEISEQNPLQIYTLIYQTLFKLNEELKRTKFLTNLGFEVQVFRAKTGKYMSYEDAKDFSDCENYHWLSGENKHFAQEFLVEKNPTRKTLEDLVANGELGKAIKKLLDTTEHDENGELHSELVNLSGRYRRNENEKHKDTSDNSDYRKECNRISDAFLKCIDQYEG
ncbi:MAG: COR domain-containing protein [Bacteroidia bacterium]